MRLVNADDIVFFGNKDSDLITFKSNIDSLPKIEAIPVEQVANFLLKFLDDPFPCNFVWFEERMVEDEWCAENCQICMKENVGNRCWLHAIKDGWLDDAE